MPKAGRSALHTLRWRAGRTGARPPQIMRFPWGRLPTRYAATKWSSPAARRNWGGYPRTRLRSTPWRRPSPSGAPRGRRDNPRKPRSPFGPTSDWLAGQAPAGSDGSKTVWRRRILGSCDGLGARGAAYRDGVNIGIRETKRSEGSSDVATSRPARLYGSDRSDDHAPAQCAAGTRSRRWRYRTFSPRPRSRHPVQAVDVPGALAARTGCGPEERLRGPGPQAG